MNIGELLRTESRFVCESRIRQRTRGVYLGEHTVLCRVLLDKKIYCDARDRGFATHLICDGFWEFWLTKIFADHIEVGDVVLDVGANLGYYTLLSAELVGPQGKVIGVEPNPEIFNLLRDSVYVNGFDQRTELLNVALSNSSEEGLLDFFVPEGEPKNGRLLSHDEAAKMRKARGSFLKVPVMPIDQSAFDRVDFVKIDVEGAEMDVLDGLEGLLSACRPKIVCEVNFSRGYSYEDVRSRLAHDGKLFHLDFDSKIVELTEEMAKTERFGDDWLICSNF